MSYFVCGNGDLVDLIGGQYATVENELYAVSPDSMLRVPVHKKQLEIPYQQTSFFEDFALTRLLWGFASIDYAAWYFKVWFVGRG